MGDSRKAISDDEEHYSALCNKYKQPYIDCYSEHARMLKELNRDCYYNLPPVKWPERIKKFEEDYKFYSHDKEVKLKERRKRFIDIMSKLTKNDIEVLEDFKDKINKFNFRFDDGEFVGITFSWENEKFEVE